MSPFISGLVVHTEVGAALLGAEVRRKAEMGIEHTKPLEALHAGHEHVGFPGLTRSPQCFLSKH